MTTPDDSDDRTFDELLHDLGPEVPRPELADEARARLLASIEGAEVAAPPEPGRRRRATWLAAAGIGLAAGLGAWSSVLWVRLGRVESQLTACRYDTGEVLHLLVSARQTQPSFPAPPAEDLQGVRRDDLMLVMFHHDLCPISQLAGPGFRQLVERHRGEPETFMTFDVTGPRRDAARRTIDELGLRYALLGPLGAETGVVKVLDTARERVLCAAPGRLGLEQAELLLSRVPAQSG